MGNSGKGRAPWTNMQFDPTTVAGPYIKCSVATLKGRAYQHNTVVFDTARGDFVSDHAFGKLVKRDYDAAASLLGFARNIHCWAVEHPCAAGALATLSKMGVPS